MISNRYFSIKKKLILIMMIVGMIPLISLGLYSANYVGKRIGEMTNDHYKSLIAQLNINTFLMFKNVDDVSKLILSSPTVKDLLLEEGEVSFREKNY